MIEDSTMMIQTALENFQEAMYERVLVALPQVIIAILIVVCGVVVGLMVHFAIRRVLSFFAIDKLADKTPVGRALRSVGIRRTVSEIFASLLFWLVLLFAFVVAADVLNLPQISHVLAVLLAFIPQIIIASAVLFVGVLVGKLLQKMVTQAVDRKGDGYGRLLGKLVFFIVIVFFVITAFDQLGLSLFLATTNFTIILSVVLIMGGLALALGSRPVMQNIIACHQLKAELKTGQSVTIGDIKGKIKEFSLTSIVLTQGENEVVLPATFFFEQSYMRLPHD